MCNAFGFRWTISESLTLGRFGSMSLSFRRVQKSIHTDRQTDRYYSLYTFRMQASVSMYVFSKTHLQTFQALMIHWLTIMLMYIGLPSLNWINHFSWKPLHTIHWPVSISSYTYGKQSMMDSIIDWSPRRVVTKPSRITWYPQWACIQVKCVANHSKSKWPFEFECHSIEQLPANLNLVIRLNSAIANQN